jgi:hypothetical protein
VDIKDKNGKTAYDCAQDADTRKALEKLGGSNKGFLFC